MEEQMVKAKKKKPSWKDIAASLAQHGFTRTPEQCSSMWSSLVKKYEVEKHTFACMLCTLTCNQENIFMAVF